MNKQQMLQKTKEKHGNNVFCFFRSKDNFEAYYKDAERVSSITGAELLIIDSVPTIIVTRDVTDKLLDAGYGVSLSMVMDDTGNYIPVIPEEEDLHLYDDE